MDRQDIASNRLWSGAGYSRAVRIGSIIEVAGTTASGPQGEILEPGDMYAQASLVFNRILAAVDELGGGPEQIIRTRVFTTDISRWEEIGRAHNEAFGKFPPTSAFYGVNALLLPGLLLEAEATAILS